MTNKQKRELEEKLKTIVNDQQNEMLNKLTNDTSNLVNIENELNFIFRQLDVVSSGLDGELLQTNEPKLYDLSGDTFFNTTSSESIFGVYTTSLKNTIDDYNNLLLTNNVTKDLYYEKQSTVSNDKNCEFDTFWGICSYNRFANYMTPIFLTPDKFSQFQNTITEGPEIKQNLMLVEQLKISCINFRNLCQNFQEYTRKFFDNVSGDERYTKAITWKLPDNAVKKCNYTTNVTNDVNDKTKRIKNLYSNNNLNEKKDTFNGKVTLN